MRNRSLYNLSFLYASHHFEIDTQSHNRQAMFDFWLDQFFRPVDMPLYFRQIPISHVSLSLLKFQKT
jgi:hypothetical protein